ncbi:hypothetical protein N7495_003340 [Penicillium taxi]|uniref:uncharacterized protein n=1 Tax=Penicillium taxi TaxID=168475 RepID=UPI0025459F30|nr:uncharacterized protein N7495_003340 [Penicillium taxi]KAJ5902812.1 hypothetical protein N7495_003340 [Penicillium taxi]
MALQLSRRVKHQGADPANSLNKALENFQNILTDEQKRDFQGNTTTPDIGSVIEFVAQIDAKNSSMTRRCVAPRLCTFLEATQQFVGVVDTFVSCNPTIAALVWGGVKTAILTASNVASYFDKVTSMIMEIGKSCPTYQLFGLLYPGCISLQRALCDYYAVIIDLCIKIIEVSRRTTLKQTLSSILVPFDSEFKLLLDRLKEAKDEIKLQISLASKQADQEAKQLLEYESRQNSKFRPSALNFFQTSLKHQAEVDKLQIDRRKRKTATLKMSIRNNLSLVNHVSPWRQALRQRVSTTAEWLQNESIFCRWNEDPQTVVLWCSGTIGMGKTVLMSNVVAQLHAVRKSNEILTYYFCRVDDEAFLSARNILGSLARQMIDNQIDQGKYETLLALEESSRNLSTNDVISFLLSRLEADKKYYVILDGLDECEDHQIQAVGQALAELCNSCLEGFKILCAGRPGLERKLLKANIPQYIVTVNKEKVESDIDRYIITNLEICLEEKVLTLRDPTHITKIYNTLRDRSDGMFLWVRLCIEELCAQNCDDDILEALKNLPIGLSELYDQKLRRVREGRATSQAIKVLEYCGIVKRPLTVTEFREALSVSLDQKSFDYGKMPNNMHKIFNGCYGFIFVDEEEDTVHYVHHSVKQYLFITSDLHKAIFDITKIDQDFGFLCMTYLDFSNFKYQLTKFNKGSDTPINPLQLVTLPVYSSSGVSSKVAQKILSQLRSLRNLSAREIERTARDAVGYEESVQLKLGIQEQGFQFRNYAMDYWLYHLSDFTDDASSKKWQLFCRCIEGNDIAACKPWEPKQHTHFKADNMPNAMQWLLSREHYALLLYFGKHQSHLLTDEMKHEILRRADIRNRYRYTEVLVKFQNTSDILDRGLSHAAADGCNRSLSVLLEVGASVDVILNGRTALQTAAEGGHLEVVQALLAAKADVNASPARSDGRTALRAAAGGGHLEVVQVLLAAKADVNASPADYYGRTALQAAAGGGHLEVVQALLAAKADVNASPTIFGGRTALQAAAGGGHLEVVQALLAAKADVNASPAGHDGRTALQAAAGGGHLEVVQVLLAAKADVNASPAYYYGRTALQAAAGGGHLEVVQVLLAAKADVNASPARSDGRTALRAAAEGGHLEVVQVLLAAKADVNASPADTYCRTALQAAAGGGHLEVVQALLAAKADVNASPAGHDGRTALQAAAGGGHLEVVQVLLAAKADVNASPAGHDGRTALQAAAGGGHLEVVQALLAAKADVNASPAGHDGRTALQAAAEGGHLEVVQALLAAKADVNASPAGSGDGRTALQAAAGGGHLEVVQALLAAKADVNASPAEHNGRTALQAAAEGGHLEVVQALLAAKADVNASPAEHNSKTALQAAAEGGHLEVVQALLAAKADVNASPAGSGDGRIALQAAAGGGHLEVVQALLAAKADVNASPAYYYGRTALQAAAGGGHLEVVQALLAAKADVNASPDKFDGRTALQAAAGGGHLEVVQALLAAKADVNASPAYYYGRTALQAAAGGGHLEVVQALLAAKADVNASPAYYYGRTALQAAAGGGHLEVVQALLAAKADVNASPAGHDGRTALQAAAEGGHLEVVQALLAAKADVNASPAGSGDGRTALQAAAGGGHLEVVQALLAAKADVNASPAEHDGRTALQAAAEGGHLEVVQVLLAAKADVNASPADTYCRTALQAAAGGGHLEVVQALLAAKADVNASPAGHDGRTALQAAAGGGHLEVVQALLAAKADVNASPDKFDGRTALQAAAGGGHLEVVQALLAAKADVNASPAGDDGRTAIQAAAKGGFSKIVEILELSGAK